jgi:hypothetical protein
MKLLTATSRTQGRRESDFTWCVEGELVIPGLIICGRDESEGPDGGCGCGRSWSGLNSGKSTTTAMVSDIEGFADGDLTLAVQSSLEQSGLTSLIGDLSDLVGEQFARVAEIAGAYPAGTVLEIRMGAVSAREECRS